MSGKVVGGIAVIALIVYLITRPSTTVPPPPEQVATPAISSDPSPASVSAPEPRAPAKNTFAGETCSGDCSGHEEGYSWAEEHDIDDEEDCDAAGEHSNSPSFAEGCKAYVNGDSDDSDGDKDDEEADPEGAGAKFQAIPGFCGPIQTATLGILEAGRAVGSIYQRVNSPLKRGLIDSQGPGNESNEIAFFSRIGNSRIESQVQNEKLVENVPTPDTLTSIQFPPKMFSPWSESKLHPECKPSSNSNRRTSVRPRSRFLRRSCAPRVLHSIMQADSRS